MDVAEIDVPSLPAWVKRWKLSVADYYRMGEAGILGEDDRVELIEGELVAMSPIGSSHSGSINELNQALVTLAGDRAVVAVQNPLRLDDHSEPEPDFVLLKARPDFYRDSHPRPADVLLVIEVADSSLTYDREVKHALYARHGISDYWIVDLTAGMVEVCRAPVGDRYTDVSRVGRDGVLRLIGLPGTAIPASRVLG